MEEENEVDSSSDESENPITKKNKKRTLKDRLKEE